MTVHATLASGGQSGGGDSYLFTSVLHTYSMLLPIVLTLIAVGTFAHVCMNVRRGEDVIGALVPAAGMGCLLVAGWVVLRVMNPASSTSSGRSSSRPTPSTAATVSSSHSATSATSRGSGGTDLLPVRAVLVLAGVLVGAALLIAAVSLVIAGIRRSRRRRAADRRVRAALKTAWQRAESEERETVDRWLAYEKDLRLLLQFPLMRDLDDPLVQRVVTAMTRAADLREIGPDGTATTVAAVTKEPYFGAVAALKSSFDSAERKAKRVQQSRFSGEEQKRLRRAQALLERAMDEANFPAERQHCYRLAIDILEELMPFPQAAVAAVEQRRLLLELEGPKAATSRTDVIMTKER